MDLVQDNDKTIRKVCNWCLNVVADRNEEWGNRIRIEKFRHHNSQWLEMIDSQQLLQEEEEQQKEEKFELPPYLNTEYLSSVVVPPLTGNYQNKIFKLKEIICVYFFRSRAEAM